MTFDPDAIRRRLRDATRWPWRVEIEEHDDDAVVARVVDADGRDVLADPTFDELDLIASAPADLDRLLRLLAADVAAAIVRDLARLEPLASHQDSETFCALCGNRPRCEGHTDGCPWRRATEVAK
jgi:hypothetical protein